LLNSYGWSDALQQQFQDYAARGLAPARVIVQQRGLYVLATPAGEATAQLSGRFAHEAEAGGYPVAGDWVAAAVRAAEGSATIHHVLPRRSAFVRKAVGGGGGAQVVAANVDVAFLVASLNAEDQAGNECRTAVLQPGNCVTPPAGFLPCAADSRNEKHNCERRKDPRPRIEFLCRGRLSA
jgi:hypothetical protein